MLLDLEAKSVSEIVSKVLEDLSNVWNMLLDGVVILTQFFQMFGSQTWNLQLICGLGGL